ncbi:MAG: CPBP family intramembrane metalloprotease [Acidobacteriia bacterium]|nr:CPBP family intramembrane metalloprotease [Terriglobia bacterium]
MPTAFLSFALLLAPYWFFGFGAAQVLRNAIRSRPMRVLAPGLLVVPYLIFSVPSDTLQWTYALAFFAIPVGLAMLFEFIPPASQKPCWQDALALAIVGLPVEFRWFAAPFPGLSALPKILLLDAALYAFLVVRGLEGVGFDLRPRLRDLAVGLREWAFCAPVAIGLGLLLGFIKFHATLPPLGTVAGALLVTFFFIAVPEELFFRGLLQNMLTQRLGQLRALLLASVIFGLSHFNKPLPFNWRYVVLATMAGIFYGRAWRDRSRIFASAITHTAVDVVWSLWFR